jgi:excisionase family DNA binding protein
MDQLLTVRELSQYIRQHPTTIYRLVEKNHIPYLRLNNGKDIRFRSEDIDQWLAASSSNPRRGIGDWAAPVSAGTTPRLLTPSPAGARRSPGGYGEMAKAKSKTRLKMRYGAIRQRVTKFGLMRWYLDYRDENGKRVQKLARFAQTLEEAELALETCVRSAYSRTHGIQEPKKIVFNDFATLYIENYAKTNKRSWTCDDYCLDAHLKPYFGKFDLRDITPLNLEAYRAQRLKAGVKKSSTNREMALLKKMFNLAADWGFCEENPVRKIRLFPEKDNLRERILTPEEEARLLPRCVPHLRPIVVFALNTGMRKGEILGLRWDQVDLVNRSIRVTKTKSGKDRTVPLNDAAAGVIMSQRRMKQGDHVFPSPKTGVSMKSVDHSFWRACRLAGILGLRFHDLRHTFATRLIRKGVDIITVKTLLGHHAVSVTERYTHSGAEERQRAVEALTWGQEGQLYGGEKPLTIRSGIQVTRYSTVN